MGYMLPSGEVADVQFSLNEDRSSPNYHEIEAFAYRIHLDEKGPAVHRNIGLLPTYLIQTNTKKTIRRKNI